MSERTPIPITVLTGFLGSGKTTLLNYWIKQPQLAHALVIINEFGQVGLDHHLVTHASEGTIIELSSGCLCCTIRGDLTKTLRDIGWRFARDGVRQFDRVVIETTGLADPAPILHTFMNEPKLAQQYRLDGVVTTVDAVNGDASLSAHAEALKQAAVADCLLVTKTDLADADQLAHLERRLQRLNPGARRLRVLAGVLDPNLIAELGLYNVNSKGHDVVRWLNQAALEQPHDHHNHDHRHDHDHPLGQAFAHDVNRHDDHIRAFSYVIDEPLAPELFDTWMALLRERRGADLLRVKGILNLSGQSRPLVIHAVQHVLHPVAQLPEWPSSDRRSRMVFITRDISREQIDESFQVLLKAGTRAQD